MQHERFAGWRLTRCNPKFLRTNRWGVSWQPSGSESILAAFLKSARLSAFTNSSRGFAARTAGGKFSGKITRSSPSGRRRRWKRQSAPRRPASNVRSRTTELLNSLRDRAGLAAVRRPLRGLKPAAMVRSLAARFASTMQRDET
jgi:hypothetical protein